MHPMATSDLPLPRIARGKVRDVYTVDAELLLLVATDRVSAFDVVMGQAVPHKGVVLTQISAWWFRRLEAVTAHHMLTADVDEIITEVPDLKAHRRAIAGRAMLCRSTMCDPRLSLGFRLEGIRSEWHARRRTSCFRPPRKRAAGVAIVQSRHQGQDRTRREHHGCTNVQDPRLRGHRRAGAAI